MVLKNSCKLRRGPAADGAGEGKNGGKGKMGSSTYFPFLHFKKRKIGRRPHFSLPPRHLRLDFPFPRLDEKSRLEKAERGCRFEAGKDFVALLAEMVLDEFAENVAEIGCHGKIAIFIKLFGFQPRPLAVDFA